MSEFRCCCLFLLVKILTGTGITSKFVCPGDSVQLFKMTNFDSCNAVVSIFVNGDRNTQIAKWTLRNCSLNSLLLPEYKDKVYFNKNGTILIHDVRPWDEGRYIMTKEDPLPMIYEEQIFVMALPTKDCRPNIVRLGNSLYAFLNHDICGKPLATKYWKDCCGISNSNESVLTLPLGKEACTCYACIVSPALKCASNSTPLDYCSSFIIEETNTPPVSLETLDVKTVVVVAVGIILGISFLLVITLIAIIIRRRRNAKVRQRYKESMQSGESQLLLRKRGIQHSTVVESNDAKVWHRYKKSKLTGAKVWKRYKESKQSGAKVRQRIKESTQLDAKVWQGYKESRQSEQMHELVWIGGIQSSAVIESDDPLLRTEEASTEDGRSDNYETTREKGPYSGHCTFCGKEKIDMFVLPCEHVGQWYMPTCIKCGISTKPCAICVASNKKYMEYAQWNVLSEPAQN